MRERGLTIREIMLIGGTRVALGVGLGLLIADKLGHDARKGVGWALLGVGVLSTVPLVVSVLAVLQIGTDGSVSVKLNGLQASSAFPRTTFYG
ncbi:MAG: hypothetical protein ACJ74Z_18250 [Bryobacteraceae bacterium]